MRAFHRCFLPSFNSFGWGVLEAYLSVIQFIANCILLIFIFKLELSPFPQKNRFFFRKHTIINMNCLWWPCLLMDRDEMSNLYRGPSIDASYQVSVHLAEFQRKRLKCEKLTDNRRRTPSDGKSSHCLWQGELKRIFFTCMEFIQFNLISFNLIL
jgi:hypothetical protein